MKKEEFKNLAFVISIIIVTYFLLLYIELIWFELFISETTYSFIWNLINIQQIVSWIPEILICFLSGCLIFKVIKSNQKFFWVLISGISLSCIKFY